MINFQVSEIKGKFILYPVDKHRRLGVMMFLSLLAPIAPVVLNLTGMTVSKSVVGINLWPVEQRNGPIR